MEAGSASRYSQGRIRKSAVFFFAVKCPRFGRPTIYWEAYLGGWIFFILQPCVTADKLTVSIDSPQSIQVIYCDST